MKYFIDAEFLEGTQKEKFPISLFRKRTKPTIDFISIGIKCEDNREYYAVSKEFNLKEAWNRYQYKKEPYNVGQQLGCLPTYSKDYWIRDNVLKPVYESLLQLDGFTEEESKKCVFNYKMLKFYKTERKTHSSL